MRTCVCQGTAALDRGRCNDKRVHLSSQIIAEVTVTQPRSATDHRHSETRRSSQLSLGKAHLASMATALRVLVSPHGVRYYVRDDSSLCALADYNSSDKMTSSNLRAYVSANNCSTAARRPAQHIKQWQLLERVMAVQRDDTHWRDAPRLRRCEAPKHFIEHHSQLRPSTPASCSRC